MDQDLIKIWNEKVNENDLVYILGDFSFYDGEGTNNILKQLKGKKILVVGNHDNKFLKDKKFNKELFEEIVDIKSIKINKTKIYMSHFPMADWNNREQGSIHFYGHLHTIKNDVSEYMVQLRLDGYNCYNVGIDLLGELVEIQDYL
jgi:calcineurin-like phosphoesterase family protein